MTIAGRAARGRDRADPDPRGGRPGGCPELRSRAFRRCAGWAMRRRVPAADRPDPAADGVRRDRLSGRAGGLGGDQVAAGPGCAGDRRRGGLRGGDRGTVPGPGRRGRRPPGAARGDRLPPHQPADRREPVLGPRPDGRASAADRHRDEARRCSTGCSPRPARSTRKTGPCAGRSAGTAPTLVAPGQGILTHCNAGGLATADYGTALAVIFAAHEQGKPSASSPTRPGRCSRGRG